MIKKSYWIITSQDKKYLVFDLATYVKSNNPWNSQVTWVNEQKRATRHYDHLRAEHHAQEYCRLIAGPGNALTKDMRIPILKEIFE